jgi:hypothetical protein
VTWDREVQTVLAGVDQPQLVSVRGRQDHPVRDDFRTERVSPDRTGCALTVNVAPAEEAGETATGESPVGEGVLFSADSVSGSTRRRWPGRTPSRPFSHEVAEELDRHCRASGGSACPRTADGRGRGCPCVSRD